ncbi:MAG: I78 family peptidase inhibitor [Paracoccus sp. (in: a-proteobacteria)]
MSQPAPASYTPAQPVYAQPADPATTQWPADGMSPQAAPGLPPSLEPAPTATQGISGLQERKPDLCGAERYASSVGQPGSTVPSLGITRSFRVVEYRGIEPQEYVPDRLVFRLDATGNISNIDCG